MGLWGDWPTQMGLTRGSLLLDCWMSLDLGVRSQVSDGPLAYQRPAGYSQESLGTGTGHGPFHGAALSS